MVSVVIWITDFFSLVVDDCVTAWTWRRSNETRDRHNGRALPEALPPIRPGTSIATSANTATSSALLSYHLCVLLVGPLDPLKADSEWNEWN